MLSIIVAIGQNNVIGKRGAGLPAGQAGLLWKLPADLKHFKDLTMGHPIIMGRKTFESIGRPLSGRTNIVITRQTDFKVEGVIAVFSLDAALSSLRGTPKQSLEIAASPDLPAGRQAPRNDRSEAFIIGGGEIYAQALTLADRLYVTEVHHSFPEGDVFFPAIDKNIWREVSRAPGPVDEKNIYPHDFIIYERIK